MIFCRVPQNENIGWVIISCILYIDTNFFFQISTTSFFYKLFYFTTKARQRKS